MSAPQPEQYRNAPAAVLELTVNNHAGVMSHICGLFARRACNVERILCVPEGDGSHSRIWLEVTEDARLEQMISQARKLVDVVEVKRHDTHAVFDKLSEFMADQ